MTPQIVLSSNNKGKLLELEKVLEPLSIKLITQSEFNVVEAEETGLSFIENAILKARSAAKQTNLPAIADDSGLVVPALNGAPGIYSARYSGVNANSQSNIELLLENMIDCQDRTAYFYCALVYVKHYKDPTPIIAFGKFFGEIIRQQQGNAGFGYDPIFFLKQYNKTAAEIEPKLKNSISHRAIASQQLLNLIEQDKIL